MKHRFNAIHQYHSGASSEDAVTNQMLDVQHHLRHLGYKSDIYATHIDDSISHLIQSDRDIVDTPNELLIVHHSMGFDAFNRILSLKNPIVTVYHNITPNHLISDMHLRYYARLGHEQLRLLAQRSIRGIAVSNYNRREMETAGFTDIDVLPVKSNYQEYLDVQQCRTPGRDWVFTGRLTASKDQVSVIEAFSYYLKNYDPKAHLYLIGSTSDQDYVETIKKKIRKLNLLGRIFVTGKLPLDSVLQRYAKVGAFVCLSNHEGFGIPLIEAMASGIPVFAYRTAAIPETMDGAGILLGSKDPAHVATSIHQVLSNKHIQQTTVSLQNARVTRLQEFDANQFWLDFINGRSSDSIQLQIQGPLDSSYSLAVLNRNLANALDQISDFTVSARQTEGPGDYISTTEDKVREPISTEIASRARNVLYPDVVIRQMYPPRLDDSTARFTIQYFGWEESRIPNSIVEKFNSHADGVIVMSQFVKMALESSGVTCPIFTVGVGVNQPDLQTTQVIPELEKLRKTRFLNISSGFPRKGLDCLITSYFNTFTGEDDLTLIIKTFPNEHNNVADLLLQAKSRALNPPHVIWIDRDMNESELGALYQNASAYVNASRGEGFGLPVAEAMLCRIPVISTANSGLADFVSERTATVISSSLVNAKSHVSEALSQWYEPNVAELERELKKFVHSDPASYQEAINNAERFIKDKFSWTEVAARTEQAVKQIMIHKHSLRLTLITTFNSRCGIAEYSQYLADHLSKSISTDFIADSSSWPLDLIAEESLQRLWKQNKQQDLSELISAIEVSDAEVVHVQHSFAFFSSHDLARLVHEVQKTRPVVITFHRTKDTPIDSIGNERDALQRAAAIVVHERHDVEFLAHLGISKNVHLIPHGALRSLATTDKMTSQNPQILRVGTFGFLLPHKGLATLIRAIQILKENGVRVHLTALCAIHPDPSSAREHQRCVTLINELNLTSEITLVTEFLDQGEIHKKLSDTDILVLPYDQTAESSSGVLAMLLSLEKPIIASDIDIFSGSRDCLVLIPATSSPNDLVDRITKLHNNESDRINYSHSVHRRYVDTSWPRVAQMHETLYRSVLHAFNAQKLPF